MTPISFCIPSRNNLKYLQSAYNSIRKHWPSDTELVLLDDASTDDTPNWIKNISTTDKFVKIYRNEGPDRVGHTILYDIGASISTNDIFGIFHADMVATPNYIDNVIKYVKPGTVVSATRIEPPLHPPGPEKIVEDFGWEPEEFKTDEFLNFVRKNEDSNKNKTTEGIFAPWVISKADFFAIGGHDKRVFAPMELEDSDLFNRFLLAGYNFVQARDAFVYHFTCRGSRFKDGLQNIQEIKLPNGSTWFKPKDSDEYTTLRYMKFFEWWRKWHMDVLHDELMMPKVCKRYDVGLILKNNNNSLLTFQLEPWCDTIYTDLPKSTIDNMILRTPSKFDLRKKFKSLSDEKINNILIEFNINEFRQEHQKVIKNLMFIIEDSGEVGEFEYDIFKFTIKSMESYEKNLIHADDPWYLAKLL